MKEVSLQEGCGCCKFITARNGKKLDETIQETSNKKKSVNIEFHYLPPRLQELVLLKASLNWR